MLLRATLRDDLLATNYSIGDVLKTSFLFSVAASITDSIPARENFPVVILFVYLMIQLCVSVCTILDTAINAHTDVPGLATLEGVLIPLGRILSWIIKTTNFLLAQFLGTTASRYLNTLNPGTVNPFTVLLPMCLLILSFIGLALYLYAPYGKPKVA